MPLISNDEEKRNFRREKENEEKDEDKTQRALKHTHVCT